MSRKLEGRYEQRHNRVAADTRNRACKSDQTESRDLVTQDVQQLSAENEILKKRCVAAQNELLRLKRQYQDLERDYRKLKRDLHSTSNELKHIHDSDFYHLALKYYKVRDRLFPENSWLQRSTKSVFRLLKSMARQGQTMATENQLTRLKIYGQYKRMDVIATKHTMFIAKLIQEHLEKVEISCEIHLGEPGEYQDIPYIIICPQFVEHFPAVYFAFQLEQTVSSRWFTPKYFTILQNSCGILDYSLVNVDFFHRPEYSDITSRVYFLPVDYAVDYASTDGESIKEKEYDVLFYGDAMSCERRRNVLEKLSHRFNVKICSEVYGEELYEEIRKAKVLVNIHYYEDALLETTRLYETLSLDACVIVSETSQDTHEVDKLKDYVDFVPVGDFDAMVSRVAYWLEHEDERKDRVLKTQRELRARSNHFSFFFYRFLLAYDRIAFATFYRLVGDYVTLHGSRLCLSLPESTERRRSFDEDNRFGFECIPGLRHFLGWVGCGLSYKLIFTKAMEQGMEEIMICEDDVIFPDDFEQLLGVLRGYLHSQKRWNVFSGVMADTTKAHVIGCEKVGDSTMIQIDHMVSTVFNIYHSSVFELISNWDEQERDVHKNAIDRYLEDKDLRVFVQLPFLVGHKEDLNSTIWRFSNIEYRELIAKSQCRLEEMAEAYQTAKGQKR